jgi:hypothetical protein
VSPALYVAHAGPGDVQYVSELGLTQFSCDASLLKSGSEPGLNPFARGEKTTISFAGHGTNI